MTAREFSDIYLSLSERLFRVAFRLLESHEDAEDAVQDLYLKLWADREKLDSVYNPEAYCISALRNNCIDRLRGEKEQITELKDTQHGVYCHSDNLEHRERLERVKRLIAKLSPSQKAVLRMRIFEDLSYEEMAELTGMSKLTMRVLLSQARSKIKHNI